MLRLWFSNQSTDSKPLLKISEASLTDLEESIKAISTCLNEEVDNKKDELMALNEFIQNTEKRLQEVKGNARCVQIVYAFYLDQVCVKRGEVFLSSIRWES